MTVDPTIVVAGIGAAGTVGAALIGKQWGRQAGKKEEKAAAETHAQTSAKTLQAQINETFGFRAAKIQTHLTVLDTNGNARAIRRWRGVQVEDGHTVSHLAGEFRCMSPGGKILGPPQLSGVGRYAKEVSLVDVERSLSFARYRVDIAGGLTYGDRPLDFDLTVSYESVVLMTMAEVEKAYANDVIKRDYLAFDVAVPVEQVELEVAFPVGVAVTAFPLVCYGWGENAHGRELARTKVGFERTATGGRFLVAGPLLGFRYLIYWTFPAAP